MNKLLLILILCLALPSFAPAQGDPLQPSYMPVIDTTCTDYPANVWVSGSLWKIRQDSGTPPTCTNGMSENGKWGTFYGTQNEFVDFQVHWHDTGSGTTGLKITVSNFTQAAPNSSTPISCATGIAEKCIVYREAYMHVSLSDCSSTVTCYTAAGYYPDILIPTVDPYWGQTTNAWPFTVAGGKNQSAWVDVLIPSAAKAGYYSGTVTVQTGCPSTCTTVATLPIIIGVWQWPNGGYMPSKPTLPSLFVEPWFASQCNAFYGSSSCSGYPTSGSPGGGGSAQQTAVGVDECITLMDHRVGCNGESDNYLPAGIYGTTAQFTSTYGGMLNGTGSSPHPAQILAGATTTNWSWTSQGIPTPTQQQTAATLFNTNGWFPGTLQGGMYYYFCDERSCSAATEVSTGNTIHSQSTPIVATLTTDTISSVTSRGALNAIDIITEDLRTFVSTSQYTSWLAGNCCGAGSPVRQTWGYQGCDDGGGSCNNGSVGYSSYPGYSIDNTPAANQAMEWYSYLNQKSGELYYAVSICTSQLSGGAGCGSGGYPSTTTNPLVSTYHQGMWGDGTMLYEVPASTWGVTTPIFIPALRLKLVRDGFQNYEYMNILTQKGKASTVTTAISSWITGNNCTGPGAICFNGNATAPAFGFTSDLQDARKNLGTALHQLTYSAGLLPPPSLTGTLQ